MIVYAVYKTIQNNDSDGWQYWTSEELLKLFTERYNAETYINELLLEDVDTLLNHTTYYGKDPDYIRKTTNMILDNKGIFSCGCDDEDCIKNLYAIQEILVEECVSLILNKE